MSGSGGDVESAVLTAAETGSRTRREEQTASRLLNPGDLTWRRALGWISHDPFHLPAYAALDASASGGAACAFLHREPGGVLLLPLVLRRVPGTPYLDATSPYGYSGPVATSLCPALWSRAVCSMQEVLGDRGVISLFVRLHPLREVPLDALREAGDLVEHGCTVSVDLTQDPQASFARLSHGHRGGARAFSRSGMQVVFDEPDHWQHWEQAYRQNMARVGASDHYLFGRAYFQRLRRCLGTELHLATAVATDGMVAGGLVFFAHDGLLEHFLVGVKDAYLRGNVAAGLYLALQAWGRERGATVQHLGGGVGGVEDSLFRFKAAFSDRRHPFRTWRVVVDEQACARLTAPGVDSGYFPAYRATASGDA